MLFCAERIFSAFKHLEDAPLKKDFSDEATIEAVKCIFDPEQIVAALSIDFPEGITLSGLRRLPIDKMYELVKLTNSFSSQLDFFQIANKFDLLSPTPLKEFLKGLLKDTQEAKIAECTPRILNVPCSQRLIALATLILQAVPETHIPEVLEALNAKATSDDKRPQFAKKK